MTATIRSLLLALLMLQCRTGSVVSAGSQSDSSAAEINSILLPELRISYRETCDPLRHNNLYMQYQVTFPVTIDMSLPQSSTEDSTKFGRLVIKDLIVTANEALASEKAMVTVMAELTGSGDAQLVFLCDTFARCQQLLDDIHSNPSVLQRALSFTVIGRLGSNALRQEGIRSANSPKLSCPAGQWVVFQRRVDGSLSFAQNWDAYVNGFGNPESNYWMGLDKLSARTATAKQNPHDNSTRCRLRIETEDFNGNRFRGEYKRFQVLGPETDYQLLVGDEMPGSQLPYFLGMHHTAKFSTFDRDNDIYPTDSCSQMFGRGGWWYSSCYWINLNGAYLTDKSIQDGAVYNTIGISRSNGNHQYTTFLPMKSTLMYYMC